MKILDIGLFLGAAATLVGASGQAGPSGASLSARCGPALDKASQAAFRLYVQNQQAAGFSAAELVEGDAECQRRMKQHSPPGNEKGVQHIRFTLDADQCVALWAGWVLPSDDRPAEKWHQPTHAPDWFPPKTSSVSQLGMPVHYGAAAFSERYANGGVGGVFNASPAKLRSRIEALLERAVDACLAPSK